MVEEKKTIKVWWAEHKKQVLFVTGGVIIGGVLIHLCLKNKGAIKNVIDGIMETLDAKVPISMEVCNNSRIDIHDSEVVSEIADKIRRAPHEVDEHLRKLPDGWHASLNKRMEAAEKGIVLPNGYTWINGYSTGNRVA